MTKKLVSVLLAVFLMLTGIVGCGDSSENDKNQSEQTEKKELMFMIDEGLHGAELVYAMRNDYKQLDAALQNIYDVLQPLTAKYKVSVHLYPMWDYQYEGYGEDPSVAINRISPALKHVLSFFDFNNIGVYLEMYSSGLVTSQNGEAPSYDNPRRVLPLSRLHYGDEQGRRALAMDMEALDALFKAYPIIKGVRFHELIGSYVWPDPNHGFKTEPEVVYEIAKVVKANDRILVWGDHMWDHAFKNPEHQWWLEILNNVSDILHENLTINFSNNSASTYESIDFSTVDCIQNYRNNNKWGYSVQSWFWTEYYNNTTSHSLNANNYYADTAFECPPELMAAFTLNAFNLGASVVQFEPAYYWFNRGFPGQSVPGDNYGTFEAEKYTDYDTKRDYTGRQILKQFVDIMLNAPEHPEQYPSQKVSDYYTQRRQELLDNFSSKNPKKYYQSTLGAIGDKEEYFDVYSCDVDVDGRTPKWYNHNENRVREYVYGNNFADTHRVNINFSRIDSQLVINEENGVKSAKIYNSLSTYIRNVDNLVRTNADGEFVSLEALNLERKINHSADEDEIVVARKKDGLIHLTVYKTQTIETPSNIWRARFSYVVDDAMTAEIRSKFGEIREENFVALLGMRKENALYVLDKSGKCGNSLDDLLLVTKTPSGLKLQGRYFERDFETELTISEPVLDIKAIDVNLDCVDDIAVLTSGKVEFFVYDKQDKTFYKKTDYSLNVAQNAEKLFCRRVSQHYVGL